MGRFSFPMSKFDERFFLTLRLSRNKINICNKYFVLQKFKINFLEDL